MSPLYDFVCERCGKPLEAFQPMGASPPICCGGLMTRHYSLGVLKIKTKYPLWVDRIDDIHKAQADRGERLRFVHPSEVGAN